MQALNTSEILSSSPFKIRIYLAGVPASVNKTNGRHWGARARTAKKWKEWVQYTVGYKKPNRPLTSYSLKIVRYSPKKLDRDNAVGSYKSIIDALVSCGILQDDRYSMMQEFFVEQQFRPRASGPLTEILIEEIL